MYYSGGKAQISDWVVNTVLSRTSRRDRYIEPFVGSAAIWTKLAPHFADARGSDAMPEIVLYLNALRDGWRPPRSLTREEWEAQRAVLIPTPMRGFAGFCSFGGMFFRSYPTGDGWEPGNHRFKGASNQGVRMGYALERLPPVLCCDYRHIGVRAGDVVYCDPPYEDTEPYAWVGRFDSLRFWAEMATWVRIGARVFVSEERAPGNWVLVASRRRKALNCYSTRTGRIDRDRTERIFMHVSQVDDRWTLDAHYRLHEEGKHPWPATIE